MTAIASGARELTDEEIVEYVGRFSVGGGRELTREEIAEYMASSGGGG